MKRKTCFTSVSEVATEFCERSAECGGGPRPVRMRDELCGNGGAGGKKTFLCFSFSNVSAHFSFVNLLFFFYKKKNKTV